MKKKYSSIVFASLLFFITASQSQSVDLLEKNPVAKTAPSSVAAQSLLHSDQERELLASKLPEKIDFWTKADNDVLAQALVNRMDNAELLSQILMFGWAGAEPNALLHQWVTQRGLGSVKVFGWNTDNIHQVARVIKMLQTEAANRPYKIPLFVATDQEGGWIRHVKGTTSETPGNMAIGASGYPMDAYYSSYYINKEISALGINMNFAPSVDLYTNLDSTIIGSRSFGSDADKAGIFGEAFSQGSIDAGVIPTAKHFPGHGDTSLDSHGKLPEIQIDYNTLVSRELKPFEYLIKARIPAVMSGHLMFPQIDKNPASLSKKMLTDILRGEMGYDGLIITDDMMMYGAWAFAGTLSRAVTMAIEAGNDIILSSSTAGLGDSLWTQNIGKMNTDKAFRARVKDAAYRVIFAKLNYFKSDNYAPLYPDDSKIDSLIPDRDGQKFFLSQACRSISVYKKGSEFPFKNEEGGRVLVAGPFVSFLQEGKKRYRGADSYYFAYGLTEDQSNLNEWNATSLTNVASAYDTIIINVFDAHSASIAKRLRNSRKRVIILSTMSPVSILNDFDWADTILCGYSWSNYSYEALFGALRGDFAPQGIIPLEIGE
ncbi:MAG: glycoside hydrolase family 3 protein [Treponema sp.]|nr:glycoside hydrolase family 3 protein [Treponema sp.]